MSSGISFPASLPGPERDSYSETFEEIHRHTVMEVGTFRKRARMRTAPKRFNLSFVFSQIEFNTFDNWWQDSIAGGAAAFDIRLLNGDDVDPLIWYTVHVIDGLYNLNVTQSMVYEVSINVRAVGIGFTDRPPGTDTLRSIISIGFKSVKGNLEVYTPYRATTSLGFKSARSSFRLPDLRGSSSFGIKAKARFRHPPLGGYAALIFDATAEFDATVANYYPEFSRQWQGIGWFRPLYSQDINPTQAYMARDWLEI